MSTPTRTPTSTPNVATSTRPQQSSRRVAHRTPLGWLPWALLGLLAALLALTFLVINALDDDGPDGAAGDTLGQVNSNGSGIDGQDGDGKPAGAEGSGSDEGQPADAGTDADANAGGPAAAGGAAGGQGAALTADGKSLLASAGGSIAGRAGQQVTGTAKVESVVSDEGFWVGSGPASRVFVFLTPQARKSQGESGFQVKAGQTVQLGGSVVALSQAPEGAAGVTEQEGRQQLQRQGAYVRAETVALAP